MRISVVIPTLNEEGAISRVIKDIPGYVKEIIVVDNCSSDNTAEEAGKAGARVISESNRGYGYACLAGIAAAGKPDILVFLDGDYSDYPEDMDMLVEPIVKDGYDLVIGSRIERMEKGAMAPHAAAANMFFGFLIRLLYGVRVTDLGPFRAIKHPKLLELEMREKRYGWTVEMQVKAIKKGYRIKEVSVRYRKRIGKSKVSGSVIASLKAAFKILLTIVKYKVT
jgi:glycosyltransferase involved in cell wall biosynthesis